MARCVAFLVAVLIWHIMVSNCAIKLPATLEQQLALRNKRPGDRSANYGCGRMGYGKRIMFNLLAIAYDRKLLGGYYGLAMPMYRPAFQLCCCAGPVGATPAPARLQMYPGGRSASEAVL